ncbi:cucumisin [Lathyrus oleraceus]|uniref:cucumisin n=1 Tax=Pisum sativum TaxID=3888 RepID=UPI0021D2ACF1|nr:cucumisin-like [Pisum sativum]
MPQYILSKMLQYLFFFVLLMRVFSGYDGPLSDSAANAKIYIVYTGDTIKDEASCLLHYNYLLQQATDSNSTARSILYYYWRSFNGFVVKLTETEAARMEGLVGVVSVFPDEKRQLLTTRSWDFVGLTQEVERQNYESDVIVGVIDSGIWPESKSFNDKGFSPPPAKWKGSCQASDFTCNNKIIGAKFYPPLHHNALSTKDIESPRDSSGHGTHTASTVAGNSVDMASMLGLAQGTARGGVPSARIAVYKVCWSIGCNEAGILAAFDDAIKDGVDILSASIGGRDSTKSIHFKDALSVGSFHAMKHGVLTVFSAGNLGPYPKSLQNYQPWTIIVGASTLDRKFITKVKTGNNRTYEGISLNTYDLQEKLYPIIYGGDAANKGEGFDQNSSRNCLANSLDEKLVKGKIILCEGDQGISEAFRVGAVGVMMQGEASIDIAISFPLPACYLQLKDAAKVLTYIRSTSFPTATIFKTIELRDSLAPVVASFSSRGPNNAVPEILKPDVIAPGVDIIASWSPISLISKNFGETRKLMFNIISGTSMACPHVSGAAAYVKSFHLTWSPAAIRSALMTTAVACINSENNLDAEFAYGAGQIDPVKAVNPGLIYDADEGDYVRFLCGQGFNTTDLQQISGDDNICSNKTYPSARDLNYPSFALKVQSSQQHFRGSFRRTVTNVGIPYSKYTANVTAPEGLHISVNPAVLSFTSVGEKQTYILTIHGKMKNHTLLSASLIWNDGNFRVRSPIIVFNERADKVAGSSNLYLIIIIIIIAVVVIILFLLFLFVL